MMFLFFTLFLAASVTAQLTTAIPLLRSGFGTDKIGFYASVIGVSGPNTTLAVTYDNGTDTRAVGLMREPTTMTISPNMFDFDTDVPTSSGTNFYNLRCDLQASADPACTLSYNPSMARRVLCPNMVSTTETIYQYYVHTYPARLGYEAGVETVMRDITIGVNTRARPTWCTDSSYLPSEGLVERPSVSREDVASYQVVVTAGEEKLKATQGSGVSGSVATPTVSVPLSTFTGAAAPVKTVMPALVGFGAVAAAFL
ncbi:hypothetical protein HBH56_073600 [Parastagonospora nodorum]|uniref:ML-like domain-containing protein n=2 Tax=Phaeosphaeria nodorum (strain SN15 / ATCC MYA-4574 / FGSC 10173) TaxID=321614 RepID=A0A7U2IBF3_PHANO|nr:hypothetical protein SNOG_13616 [Parastagonospora nodorum SN15]KAH3915395.1 hypothetical protein HBH56_073600 [Parastagonospora nodorum]EAT79063.1 hypothetical protein SNOG_13616 [Parastagonospora nodorum SN15]KAH3927291.1 hypothetical protein HBH54_153840 [Parastagonospora nodorum]KAH3983316.1 hypothetical protein HBH52_068190 [Parastagonospora nodorum]KAH4069575.1 hypothetical protein HBH50_100900 [Parastagonospora nodorum]